MEAELKASYPDSTVKLIQGSGGVFDVTCNGKIIYSKQTTEGRRFPNNGEITKLIREAAG